MLRVKGTKGILSCTPHGRQYFVLLDNISVSIYIFVFTNYFKWRERVHWNRLPPPPLPADKSIINCSNSSFSKKWIDGYFGIFNISCYISVLCFILMCLKILLYLILKSNNLFDKTIRMKCDKFQLLSRYYEYN